MCRVHFFFRMLDRAKENSYFYVKNSGREKLLSELGLEPGLLAAYTNDLHHQPMKSKSDLFPSLLLPSLHVRLTMFVIFAFAGELQRNYFISEFHFNLRIKSNN